MSTLSVVVGYFGAQLEFAKRVQTVLVGLGMTVWLDEGQFGKDDVFWAAVDYGMRSSKLVITCISDSYASRLQYQKEMNLCDGLRKPAVSFFLFSSFFFSFFFFFLFFFRFFG